MIKQSSGLVGNLDSEAVSLPVGRTRTLEGHTGGVYGVAFSADGRSLASAGADRTVRLWDPATGERTRTLEGHIGEVRAVAFSPDGRSLASVGHDQTVRLWDLDRLAVVAQVEFGSPVRALAWNESGLAVGTGLGEVAMLTVIDRGRPAPDALHNIAR